MGYYSGVATDADDMVEKIGNHCSSEGWSILQDAVAGAGRVLRVSTPTSPGVQYLFRSTPPAGEQISFNNWLSGNVYDGIGVSCCLGHTGGTGQRDWMDNAVNPPVDNDKTLSNGRMHFGAFYGAGAISSYEMFFDKDFDFFMLVMNISGSSYKTICAGDVITYGTQNPGGQVAAATNSGWWNKGVHEQNSRHEAGALFGGSIERTYMNGVVRWDDPEADNLRHWASNGSRTWGAHTRDSCFGPWIAHDRALVESSPNEFNGLTCLTPILLQAQDEFDVSRFIPYGRIPNFFHIKLSGLSPGDSYFIGEFEYKVYPWLEFDNSDYGNSAFTNHSGSLGFAVRKDDA